MYIVSSNFDLCGIVWISFSKWQLLQGAHWTVPTNVLFWVYFYTYILLYFLLLLLLTVASLPFHMLPYSTSLCGSQCIEPMCMPFYARVDCTLKLNGSWQHVVSHFTHFRVYLCFVAKYSLSISLLHLATVPTMPILSSISCFILHACVHRW